jgi:hypothetical protein
MTAAVAANSPSADELSVEVLSLNGSRLCSVDGVPRDVEVRVLCKMLAKALPRELNNADVLVYGGVPLMNLGGKPFQEAAGDAVSVTAVFSKEFAMDDLVYYNGPYINGLQTGTYCQIKSDLQFSGDNGFVWVVTRYDKECVRSMSKAISRFDAQRQGELARGRTRVNMRHLSRYMEAPRSIPGGYEVGEAIFYVGPSSTALSCGTQGSVLAAGVLEHSVQVTFGYRTMALPLSHISRHYEAPIETPFWSRLLDVSKLRQRGMSKQPQM